MTQKLPDLKRGKAPTFVSSVRQDVIDHTIHSLRLQRSALGWWVSEFDHILLGLSIPIKFSSSDSSKTVPGQVANYELWWQLHNRSLLLALFYYAYISLISLGTLFRCIFSILVALSLLPTYNLSLLLFGRNWESAISALATFLIRTSRVVILPWWAGHTHLYCGWGRGFVTSRLFKRMGGEESSLQ